MVKARLVWIKSFVFIQVFFIEYAHGQFFNHLRNLRQERDWPMVFRFIFSALFKEWFQFRSFVIIRKMR